MITGTIRKLTTQLDTNGAVSYQLPIGDQSVALNPLISKYITLEHTGNIYCTNCSKKTKKSYSQGYCYVCMRKLAACDLCIMKPETCHFEQGTCREPVWGKENCFIPHYVYLANTSGIKVGITRHREDELTPCSGRWIDQGATQAVRLFEVDNRLRSGQVEILLAGLISDKTNWRKMLQGNNELIDLKERAKELIPLISDKLKEIKLQYGEESVVQLDEDIVEINYPVNEYPIKIKSFNFDKEPIVEGILMGIKGQYLIFDTGVINMRKFGSYEINISY